MAPRVYSDSDSDDDETLKRHADDDDDNLNDGDSRKRSKPYSDHDDDFDDDDDDEILEKPETDEDSDDDEVRREKNATASDDEDSAAETPEKRSQDRATFAIQQRKQMRLAKSDQSPFDYLKEMYTKTVKTNSGKQGLACVLCDTVYYNGCSARRFAVLCCMCACVHVCPLLDLHMQVDVSLAEGDGQVGRSEGLQAHCSHHAR